MARGIYNAKNHLYAFKCFLRAMFSRNSLILVGCHTNAFVWNAYHFIDKCKDMPGVNMVAAVTTASIYPCRMASIPCVFKGGRLLRLLAWRARVVCCTGRDLSDFGFSCPGTFHVALWHGMPMKAVGIQQKPMPVYLERMDLTLATSSFTKEIMMRAFGETEERVAVTGEPKTDAFWDTGPIGRVRQKLSHYSKIILYLPTFRDIARMTSALAPVIDLEASVKPIRALQECADIRACLESQNACLLLGIHPFLQSTACGNLQPPFLDAKELNAQTEHLIAAADFIISDYSSVAIDLLAIQKPFVLFCPDYDEYEARRGLPYFDVREMFSGHFCENAVQVAGEISHALASPSWRQDSRRKLHDIFHLYTDGKSSQRALTEILSKTAHPVRTLLLA